MPGTGVTVTANAGAPCGVTAATFGAGFSIIAALFRHDPDQYEDIHVVCVITDAWTINEVTATLPSNRGRPTLGLTTHQILPWFMSGSPSMQPRRPDVRQEMRDDRDDEEHPRPVDHMLVQLFRFPDRQASGPNSVQVILAHGYLSSSGAHFLPPVLKRLLPRAVTRPDF
jgi:hypothetical protein